MIGSFIAGYLLITLGLFCLIFFAGKLLFQLLGVVIGITLITKGMRRLSFDRQFYSYSMNYFNDNFRK